MDNVKLIGYKAGTFEDRANGRLIEYRQLFGAYVAKDVVGLKTETYKCSAEVWPQVIALKPGAELNLYYDKYGRVIGLKEVTSK